MHNIIAAFQIAHKTNKKVVRIKKTNLNLEILNILYLEGCIRGYKVYSSLSNLCVRTPPVSFIEIYDPVGDYTLYSKPSRPVYVSSKDVENYLEKNMIVLLSTSKGIYSSRQLLKLQKQNNNKNIGGGKLLCSISLM